MSIPVKRNDSALHICKINKQKTHDEDFSSSVVKLRCFNCQQGHAIFIQCIKYIFTCRKFLTNHKQVKKVMICLMKHIQAHIYLS